MWLRHSRLWLHHRFDQLTWALEVTLMSAHECLLVSGLALRFYPYLLVGGAWLSLSRFVSVRRACLSMACCGHCGLPDHHHPSAGAWPQKRINSETVTMRFLAPLF